MSTHATYLITYQLRSPEESYTSLIKYLKTARQWAKPCANVWIIKADTDVTSIRDGIRGKIKQNDKAFVTEVQIGSWATFNVQKEVTNWLQNNL